MCPFRKKVTDSLKIQEEIFGDILFGKTDSIDKLKPISFSKNEPELFLQDFEKSNSLDELFSTIKDCRNCTLGNTRNKFVFGKGNHYADVLCIGEGPGADEDTTGEPFVGRAGQLLTDILKAIKFSRDEVFIANIVKCRPPNNRTPFPNEIKECIPYLYKQIDLIKPKVILCLGLTAAQALLQQKDTLTNFRGNVYNFINPLSEDNHPIKVMVTYHPAALLRNPNWKKGCWTDVQLFRKLYDSCIQDKSGQISGEE